MKTASEKYKQLFFALAAVVFFHQLFMVLSGKGLLADNPYNSYARQAFVWSRGYLDVGGDSPWLELAVYNGGYFVSFPPFPSYVLLPLVLVFGMDTPDHLLAFLIMLVGVTYAVRLAQKLNLGGVACVFLPVFLYCGTGIWQITVDGWVWFFAQNFSLTLTFMSLYYALEGKKGAALFFLCCATGCRPFQLLYLPLVLSLLLHGATGESLYQKGRDLILKKCYVYIPTVLLAASYLLLNFLRFDNPFEFGHNYLPEFTGSEQGQFSMAYISTNFNSLWRLPTFNAATASWAFPNFNGMNIFLTFPLLLFYLVTLVIGACKRGIKGFALYMNVLVLALSALHVLLLLSHKTMGGAHFGNRYICDIMPAVFFGLLFLLGDKRRAKPWYAIVLLLFLFGLFLNFYGVLLFYCWV